MWIDMVEFSVSLLLIIGTIVSAFSIVIAFLIYAYITPARNSPAWLFIEAKKKRRPVILLDNGSFWKISLGRAEGSGFVEDNEGSIVTVTPNSLKSCLGVRVGVGEYHRSITANPVVMQFIKEAEKKSFDAKDAKETVEEFDVNKVEELKNNGTERKVEKTEPKSEPREQEFPDGIETY